MIIILKNITNYIFKFIYSKLSIMFLNEIKLKNISKTDKM